ncbi:MAG: SpoIID/LytB domain-containing protein [Firmicutes bacterium]|nr:SpoIID/LytB domain-containing protein [Bacillota bacterium]
MNKLFGIFNQGGQGSPIKKIFLVIGAAAAGLFIPFLIFMIIMIPVIVIDAGMNALESMANGVSGFFERLGNTLVTGYWGTNEEVFYDVIQGRYESFEKKGVIIDVPLVLSATFINQNMNIGGNCKLDESAENEKKEEKENTEEKDTKPDSGFSCANSEDEESYKKLRKDAVKLMDGMVEDGKLKSEEDYKKWLRENYIEEKLESVDMNIPNAPAAKERFYMQMIDYIYANRDLYNAYANGFGEKVDSGTGVCSYNVPGQVSVSNLKVRLLECDASGPVAGEELVDFEKYILGVTWQENGSAPDEAVKTQAIAARSYSLVRGKAMNYALGIGKIEKEGDDWILQLRACTNDHAYCDPDKGCWSDNAGGEGTTIHSGYNASKNWSRQPLPQDSKLRNLVNETRGQVWVDANSNIVNTNYMQPEQTEWNNLATNGKNVLEILKKGYPSGREIVSSCTGGASAGSFASWKQYDLPMSLYLGSPRYGASATANRVGCLASSFCIHIARAKFPLAPGMKDLTLQSCIEGMKKGNCFTSEAYWTGTCSFKYVTKEEHSASEVSVSGNKATIIGQVSKMVGEGCMPILNVSNGGHWVPVDRVENGELYIYDSGWPTSSIETSVNITEQFPKWSAFTGGTQDWSTIRAIKCFK